jgi:hypothetical protein
MYGDLGGASFDHHDASIGRPVPLIYRIAPAAAQCPYREIEPEGRNRPDEQRQGCRICHTCL